MQNGYPSGLGTTTTTTTTNGGGHHPGPTGGVAVPGGGGGGTTTTSDNFASSATKTLATVAAATAFGGLLGLWKGRQSSLEFFSGYLVEQSLSVDNLFVFIMLFEYFRVPPEYQQRVLTWGIAGAVAMRGLMIVAGVAAVRRFKWMTLLFAGILMLSSIKLLMESSDDDDDADGVADNFVVRLSRRLVGATSEYDGDRFFTERCCGIPGGPAVDDDDDDDDDDASRFSSSRYQSRGARSRSPRTTRSSLLTFRTHKNGASKKKKRVATPLLLTLVCVELSDVVFAVDSIPAVLGISTDPLVVYSSNIFAIAGLRALYTLVARAVDSLVFLKPAVCLVLLFISFKMILEYFSYHLSVALSLSVVVGLLAGGAFLSLCCAAATRKKKKNKKKREPPSLSSGKASGFDDLRDPVVQQPSSDHLHRRVHSPAAVDAYSASNDLSKVLV